MAGVGAGDENGTMISLISAPTNLGLKPPVRGAVPGTAKAAEALREAGFTTACWPAARETAGAVLPAGMSMTRPVPRGDPQPGGLGGRAGSVLRRAAYGPPRMPASERRSGDRAG